MAQFTIYNSSDVGSPELNGRSGSLINVLNAILVTGYGSKTGAGWISSYTSASATMSLVQCYQMPSGSDGFFLRVNDGYLTGREATLRAWESMSNVNSGSYPFPSAAQSATADNGVYFRKSSAETSVPKPWMAFADSRSLYFFAQTGDASNVWSNFMFGEIYSYKAGDTYKTALIGRTDNADNADTGATNDSSLGHGTYQLLGTNYGHFLARSYTTLGGSISFGVLSDPIRQASSTITHLVAGSINYPNGPDGGIYILPLTITEGSSLHIRGRMRGCYGWLHTAAAINDGDTFSGLSDFSGKSFRVIKIIRGTSTSPDGCLVMETSDTLDTN